MGRGLEHGYRGARALNDAALECGFSQRSRFPNRVVLLVRAADWKGSAFLEARTQQDSQGLRLRCNGVFRAKYTLNQWDNSSLRNTSL